MHADFDALSEALKAAFCEAFEVDLMPGETPEKVQALAATLENAKYARKEWNDEALRT